MGRNILKNTGRIILLLFLLIISSGLYAVEIETELSSSKIAVGESATLRIRINEKSSKVKPVKFPALNGLQITFSGSSRSFEFVNGKTWSGTVLNFSIYGEKKGEYRIPPFILEADGETVSSREVKLTVVESSSGRSNGEIRGELESSRETVYIGEPVILRYFINNGDGDSPHVERFIEQPHAKGFVIKKIDEQLEKSGKTYAGSYCIIPLEKGVHDIGGGSVEVIMEMSQGFFSMNQRGGISFPLKKITVFPLPLKGKPDNFAGDVGEFKIEAEVPRGTYKLFEEIKIPVKISGRGNLLTLSNPKIENDNGIKTVIEEKEQNLSRNEGGLSGEKKFLLTVIPQIADGDGVVNIGRIFIEYFNPYKKIYERSESVPLSFKIQAGDVSERKDEVKFETKDSSGYKMGYFTAAIVILVLTILVIALVMWERKKLRIIKSELKSDLPDEDKTPVVDIKNEILQNLQISVKNKNAEMFLLNADRGINQLDSAKLSSAELVKYNIFKDKVYYCRYGGGEFDETEMHDLSEWLKRYLK